MLTSLETLPEATPVDIPPLDNCVSFEAAIRSGHGKYVFSSDNEVLFLGDREIANGYGFTTPTPHGALTIFQ